MFLDRMLSFNVTHTACNEVIGPKIPAGILTLQLDASTALKFREFHYDIKDWITDGWDDNAIHYGYFANGILAGVLRAVYPQHDALPVNSHIPDFEVQPGDCQIGRLLVAPEFRATKVIGFMMRHFANELVYAGSRIIVTPRETINLSPERFVHCGFRLVQEGFDTKQGLVRNLWIRKNDEARLPSLDALTA